MTVNQKASEVQALKVRKSPLPLQSTSKLLLRCRKVVELRKLNRMKSGSKVMNLVVFIRLR